jgi:hypothetical protein
MVSPEFAAFLSTLRSRPTPAGLSIAELRQRFSTFAGQFVPDPDPQFEPVDADGVPAEWCIPVIVGKSIRLASEVESGDALG